MRPGSPCSPSSLVGSLRITPKPRRRCTFQRRLSSLPVRLNSNAPGISARATASVLQLRRYLGREIGPLALDALTEREACKACNADRRARAFTGLLDDF